MDLINVVNLNADVKEMERKLNAISARRRRGRRLFGRKRG